MNKLFAIALCLSLLVACKKETIVFDGAPNESFELPLILKLNGKECFYDEASGVLKYSLAENALENFSPQTEFQAHSTVLFDGKPLTNNAVNHLGDIILHKRYAVDITTNGKTKHLQLVFTDMPLVRVVTFDKITNEPKTLAKMTVNYAGLNEVPAIDWIGIELRGASSLSFEKNSYGVGVYAGRSTEDPVSRSYFGMTESPKWILDAMYVDKARCRNKASFALWASMGEADSHPNIRSVFVEVFLNSRSLGLYCFSESYCEEVLDLGQQSVLYKGLDNSAATFFEQLPENAPGAAVWGEWEQRFPDPSEQVIWDDFQSLSTLIVNGSDAEFTQSIGSVIDLGNVIDYYLLVNLCGGSDNLGKNWHFLKRSPGGKFIIAPWDLDATWGRNAFGDAQSPHGRITNRLFDRLKALNPENYNQRLSQRWNQLRLNQFSQAQLFSHFSEHFSALKHYRILETENEVWNQSLNIGQEQAYIKSWIVNRLAYLDEQFQ
jgi:hypothetical protein